MSSHPTADSGQRKPIENAKDKTEKVQQELDVAGAELHLTNTALDASLPQAVKKGDVAKALRQNAVIEDRVQDAAQELEQVTELLEEEVAQRARLERRLASAGLSPL